MLPPRPFLGAPYDKNMFTFLPVPSKDNLAESSRKRKLVSSDHQISVPAPCVSHGFEMSNPKLSIGDGRGQVLQSSGPVSIPEESLPEESLHSGNYLHKNQYWDQRNCMVSLESNRRDFRETRSEDTESFTFSRKLQSLHHKGISEGEGHKTSKWSSSMAEKFIPPENHGSNANVTMKENFSPFQEFQNCAPHTPVQTNSITSGSREQAFKNLGDCQNLLKNFLNSGSFVVASDGKGSQTHQASAWPPQISQNLNQLGKNQRSNAHLAGNEIASHFQEFQTPVQMKVVASGSREQASGQCLQQNFVKPGASFVGADGQCCPVGTYKVNVDHRNVDCTFAGQDSARMLGDNVNNSVYNLQCETNNLLQNALRLLSASGIGLANNYAGQIQGPGDDVKMINTTTVSVSLDAKDSLSETTFSKNGSCCRNLDNEKDSVVSVEERKVDKGASTPTEKLWDGTLQLSSSVTVSVIAFFKSGEMMQDFCWSESVEVIGKVRLEAFEKYVQDLPRSRTRGLMLLPRRIAVWYLE